MKYFSYVLLKILTYYNKFKNDSTGKRVVKGSMIGSIEETQEMMDLCGKHNITCDIEMVSTNNINEALDRLAKNDVKYRFVIDIASKSSNL